MIWASKRERELSDFAELLAQAGLQISRVSENPAGHSVIEPLPV